MQESTSVGHEKASGAPRFGIGQKLAFGTGSFSQWFVNAAFITWVFQFYFSAIRLPVELIWIAYIIWAIASSVTNPVVGFISDRTKTRFGRRKPYIIAGTILILPIEVLIWLPPASVMGEFVYLIIMLLCYDIAFTMIGLPFDALFPELYTSVEERAQVNMIKQIMAIIGLLAAFLIPGYIIGTLTASADYLVNGIVTTIIVGMSLLISLKWGVTERTEFKLDYKQDFGFLQNLKHTVRNRGFVIYTALYFMYEYILLILSTSVYLYSLYVLGVKGTFMASIMIGMLFIVGFLTVVIWRKLDVKYGSKRAYGYSIIAYLVASVPLFFVTVYVEAVIIAALMGFGFGGMLYFVYLLIADVIDEDELKTGVRREGAFFGVTDFFMRLAMVVSITTVALVFSGTGWSQYTPLAGVDTILGLRCLVVVFPGVALLISYLLLHFYPFTKQRVAENKERIKILHEEKLGKVIAANE
jgi:GPH family glycoside/pentoside/hexuronide:cation symporter